MCGITGLYTKKPFSFNRYYTAHKLLQHRGPDDEGFVVGKGTNESIILSGDGTKGRWLQYKHINETELSLTWVLGHHRLSILDLSENGHQPMSNDNSRYWIILNGEIYNYKEIRDELRQKGITFHTETDTEVVLQAFIKWGETCFQRFNGMWSLAIYDVKTQKLILSRDRFGIKPLYYHFGDEQFLFASEVKFFKPLLKLNINQEVAAEYIAFSQLDHRQDTFYEEVKQFPAASYAIYSYKNHTLNFNNYWSLDKKDHKDSYDIEDAKKQFEELFSSSIDLRMRSDVPVGCLLSGGLDSTAIVCNLSNRRKFPSDGFHSFSADFKEEKFTEKSFIDQTSLKCNGLISHFVYPNALNIQKDLNNLLWVQDFPLRSLSVYSQNLLYRDIRQNSPVVVLLNGQGSDEIFGGYSSHYYSFILNAFFNLKLKETYENSKWLIKNRGVQNSFMLMFLLKQSILKFTPKKISSLRSWSNPYFSTKMAYNTPSFSNDPFKNELQTNLLYTSLPEYLRYEDRNSMAYSTESRLPFLDYRLVEWAMSLPNELKIQNGVNKRIVRESVKAYTTSSVIARTDKMGFVSPQEVWQRTFMKEFMTEVMHSDWNIPFLSKEKAIGGFENYQNSKENNWPFWWRIFCYIYWKKSINEQ